MFQIHRATPRILIGMMVSSEFRYNIIFTLSSSKLTYFTNKQIKPLIASMMLTFSIS